jgi:YD repeat-containing protein
VASFAVGDWFEFEIGEPAEAATGAPGQGLRFPIRCRLEGRQFENSHLDAGHGDPVLGAPDLITAPDLLAFAEIAHAKVRCYPLTSQVAEKLHAYTRTYESGETSRARDLADILLAASLERLNSEKLRQAIEATYQARATHPVPQKMPSPPDRISAPTVSFSYTPTGKRLSMTDASGATNYSYDVRDRMTAKAGPEGTLNYAYDSAGNLLNLSAVAAMSPSPTVVNYTYDALNRLSAVAEANTGTTQYNYDPVGNLASFTEPNGVTHAYTYDSENRLTSLVVAAVSSPATPLASYAYTLDSAGHRTAVVEKSGGTVNYGYDSIYRLTSETIANDPNSINGTIGYPQYDNVGNRLQQTSTVTGIAAGLFNYDPDDRLNTNTYDPNGNTLTSAGNPNTNVYDFEK